VLENKVLARFSIGDIYGFGNFKENSWWGVIEAFMGWVCCGYGSGFCKEM
jgi:hypothetical protein